MLIRHLAIAGALVVGVVSAAVAQTNSGDPPPQPARRPSLVTSRDLRTFAFFLSGAVVAFPLDGSIASRSQSASLQQSGALRDVASGFRTLGGPGTVAVTAGLFAAGKICGCRGVANAGLHSMEALALAAGTTQILKLGLGRARPEPSVGLDPGQPGRDPYIFRPLRGRGGFTAFPSGHASAAFAVAAALSADLSTAPGWVTPSLYGAATLVGLSRIYNNKHWATDVIVGAAVGTYLGRKVVELQRGPTDRRPSPAAPSLAATPNGLTVMWSLPLR